MVLEGIPYSMALPYLDDTCVHGRDFPSHLAALKRVLQAHIRAGLKLQPSKCQLFQEEIEYLGFMVSGRGLYPVPKYLRVVKEWPLPRTRTEARAFLGKVGYYRRFIQNFSAIAKPWTDITGQEDAATEKLPLDVSPEMERSFQTLKHCLLTAPILAYPRFDSKEPFILDTDWSQDHATVGAVLSQKQDGKERVICYGSKKMAKSRANYAPTKGELYAVIHFIKEFEYYLRFRPFVLRTDHAALKWIQTMEKPTGMVERWLQTLANHNFTVEYRPGKRHQNADALSRISHADPADPDEPEDEDPGISSLQLVANLAALLSPHPWTREEVHQAQSQDGDWRRITEWVKLQTVPTALEKKSLSLEGQGLLGFWPQLYVSRDGLLHRRPPSPNPASKRPPQLCLPPALWDQAVAMVHAAGGHMGRDATLARLMHNVFFPGMKKRVEEFLLRCPNCQTKQQGVTEQRHTLVSQIPGFPFQKLAIDFVGPLKVSHKGNKYLLTVKCVFTKWLEAFAMPEATADRVVRTLEKEIFARYGYCEQIHSDQGTQFTSKLFKEVGDLLGIKITTTPAYNPKSNPVERSHRDLGAILRAMVANTDRSWEEVLPQALFALRTTPCRSTGLTPFQLMFGREASQPLDLIFQDPDSTKEMATHQYVQKLKERIQAAHDFARQNMTTAVKRQRRQYCKDKKLFQIGQRVWLFTPKVAVGESKKLSAMWTGPWTIVETPSDLLFTIRPNPAWLHVRGDITVGIDRLKPYRGPDPYAPDREPGANDDLDMDGDEFCEHLIPPAANQPPAPLGGGFGGGGGPGGGPPPGGGGGGPSRPSSGPSPRPTSPSGTPSPASSISLGFGLFDDTSPRHPPGTPANSDADSNSGLLGPNASPANAQASPAALPAAAASPFIDPADSYYFSPHRLSQLWRHPTTQLAGSRPGAPPDFYRLTGTGDSSLDDPTDPTFDIRDVSMASDDSRYGHQGGDHHQTPGFIRGRHPVATSEESKAQPQAQEGTATDTVRPRRRAAEKARWRLADWLKEEDEEADWLTGPEEKTGRPVTPTEPSPARPSSTFDEELARRLREPGFERAMQGRSRLTARTPPPNQAAQEAQEREESAAAAFERQQSQRSQKTKRTP